MSYYLIIYPIILKFYHTINAYRVIFQSVFTFPGPRLSKILTLQCLHAQGDLNSIVFLHRLSQAAGDI